VSNRDEKAAIEAAMKRGEELEEQLEQANKKLADAELRAVQATQKVAQAERGSTQVNTNLSKLQAELTAMKAELSTAKSEAAAARNRAVQAEQKLASVTAELAKHNAARQADATAAAARAMVLDEHDVKAGETLSGIALKYYGSAGEAYWRLIYNANKEAIGGNPGMVRAGTKLNIPVLPEEMKKK
jgi:nucleoid-associated protein YgaU